MLYFIQLIDFLGEIRNDTEINGKAFIFKILIKDMSFECILFVHPDIKIKPFLTFHDKKYEEYEQHILSIILEQFNINDLLAYEN